MRILAHDGAHSSPGIDDATVEQLYAWPDGGGVRANFVGTLDGAATGADGLTGSINNEADGRAFNAQRRLCDVVLVGAGTAEAEGYRPLRRLGTGHLRTLVVVSASGRVPEPLRHRAEADDPVVLLTCGSASPERIESARATLGDDSVWVHGDRGVDLAAALSRLRDAGRTAVLCEGGPTLFGSLLSAGIVDEVALTITPTLVGGDLKRIVNAGPLHDRVVLRHLLEQDGTLLTLWSVRPA